MIRQVISLANLTDGAVGDRFGGPGFDELAIEFIRLLRLTAQVANEQSFLRFLVPASQVADSQIVEVVGQQLFQTGSADVGQLDLRFLRARPCFASFENVLLARPRRLNHLVDGAISAGKKLVSEAEGDVVDDFRFLVGQHCLIVTSREQ